MLGVHRTDRQLAFWAWMILPSLLFCEGDGWLRLVWVAWGWDRRFNLKLIVRSFVNLQTHRTRGDVYLGLRLEKLQAQDRVPCIRHFYAYRVM